MTDDIFKFGSTYDLKNCAHFGTLDCYDLLYENISGKQISCLNMIGNVKGKAFPVHSFSLTWSYCGSTMASGFGTDMRSNSVSRHSTGVQVICPLKTVSSDFCTHFVVIIEKKKEGMAMHVETAMQ